MDLTKDAGVDPLYAEAESSFEHWEVVKDLVDEMIDLMLNYRQSGHPGGSRSKVHVMLATMLSGAMHWDVLRPWRRFADRFVLSAGHTIPLVYACLAVFNEALRARHETTGDDSFGFPEAGAHALTWALSFRSALGACVDRGQSWSRPSTTSGIEGASCTRNSPAFSFRL